ncbi:hypothetical protein [Streptomyces sp. NPDC005407]|uniref:hypothetical protein n=1 Tax=Streptomyces sp. NPDC005407 TaxID=3155340 RepID=UPI0033A1D408
MIRFAHKELSYAGAVTAAGVIAGGVGVAVNGPVEPRGWWGLAAIPVWAVLWRWLNTTRLLQRGDLPMFEAAVPIADPGSALGSPDQVRRTLRKFYGKMFAFWIVGTTALAYFEPLTVVFCFVHAADALLRGVQTARWERWHGVLLWQGHVEQEQQPAGIGRPRCYTTPRQGALVW